MPTTYEYADDTTVVADSSANLQKGLDILKSYCDMWKSSVNIEKNKITIFEKRRSGAQLLEFCYAGVKLEITPIFCLFLRINLASNGKRNTCIDSLLNKGQKAMFAILRKAREQNMSPDIQIDLFHKLVLPILSYGCEIWAYDAS